MESCSVSLSALLRLGLSGCVFGARLQEVSSPAGGAARKAALEPERHLLVKYTKRKRPRCGLQKLDSKCEVKD